MAIFRLAATAVSGVEWSTVGGTGRSIIFAIMRIPFVSRLWLSTALTAAALLGSPAESARASDSAAVFNEVQYHPATTTGEEEWIELANLMAVDMDLSGWQLTGAVTFTFPEGSRLKAGGYLLVAAQPAAVPGALGPWNGRLSNNGERLRLLNVSGRLMDELDYGDDEPWPAAADGSGATLARRQAGTASPGAAAWTASLETGGTPGTGNFPSGPAPAGVRISEITAAGPLPFQVELVNEGASPFPLTDLRLGTFTPTVGVLEPGAFIVYGEAELGFSPGDGETLFLWDVRGGRVLDAVTAGPFPRARSGGRMMQPKSPSFGDANRFALSTDVVINEIMYEAPPFASIPGQPEVVETKVLVPLDAVWRYRTATNDPGPNWAQIRHEASPEWLSGQGLLGFETTPATLPDVLRTPFLSTASPTYYFETEFTLTAEQAASLSRLQIEHVIDDGAAFYLNGVEVTGWRINLPEGTIRHGTLASAGVPNAVLSPPRDTPLAGLALVSGVNRLSIEVHQQLASGNDMVCGARLSAVTTVTPEVAPAPVAANPDEWIELHNQGATPVDLTGWSLDQAVRFTFPTGTTIAAGSFLVVAKQSAKLKQTWPERAPLIIGDFTGSLSANGEIIALLDAAGNPADEARYHPSPLSNGGGSSLELTDSRNDNSHPQAWVDSDETAKSEWKSFSWRAPGTQKFGPTVWNEFRLGLLDAGACLIDDLRVRRDPDGAAVELLRNGDFEKLPAGANWRLLGNHAGSRVVEDPANPANRVLRLAATGPTETNHNHAETTFVNNAALTSGVHEVSFRARWLSGTNQLNTRAYYQKLARTWELPIPAALGTPGARNSRAVAAAEAGPVLSGLLHTPSIPAPRGDVTVSLAATDPDGVTAAVLYYRINPASTFETRPMALTDGRWSTAIPGQTAGAIVHFYATVTDSVGAISQLPTRGPDSRALVQWQDSQTTQVPAHQLRLIMLPTDRNFLLAPLNRLSNDRVPGTLVYRGTEVFHDVGVRLQGTAAGRVRDGDPYIGYDIAFPPDHLVRGLHTGIGIDRSARSPVVRRQDEMYVRHTFNRAGLPCTVDDLCYFIAPTTTHTGPAILQMAAYGGQWTDSQFPETTGTVYNYDITYDPITVSPAGNPENLKPAVPFEHIATDLTNLGQDKEQYRGPFDIRAGKRRDDYTGLIRLAQTMVLPSAQLAVAAPEIINLDQVFQCTALVNLWGIGDTYYTGGLPHNIRLFVPENGRGINFLPWDMDFVMSGATNAPLIPSGNNLARLITSSPGHRRRYLGHIRHLCETVFNAAALNPWLTHYGSVVGQTYSGTANYVNARRTFAQSQYPARSPFAVTTNGGTDFTTETSEVVLEGTGWIDLKEIRRNGLPVAVTWLDLTRWRVTLPLLAGANVLQLEAVGFDDAVQATQSLTITSTTAAEPRPRDLLRMTEIHYHPANPTTPAELAASSSDSDFEFIELKNIGTETVRLEGVRFTSGIDLVLPAGARLDAGAMGVIVRNRTAFAARYGTGITVLAAYGPDALDNAGETLTLTEATGEIIQSFTFDPAWLPSSDGAGWSLVVRHENAASPDLNTFAAWALSGQRHGHPGTSNGPVFSSEFTGWQNDSFSPAELASPATSAPEADPTASGLNNLLRYAFGLTPQTNPPPATPIVTLNNQSLRLDVRRRQQTVDLDFILETSTNFATWTPSPATPVVIATHPDGTETVRWETPAAENAQYFRVRVRTQ